MSRECAHQPWPATGSPRWCGGSPVILGLEARHSAPPVFARLIRFPVVIAAAQLYGVGLDVGGPAELLGAGQPAAVVRHVGKQLEQDAGRRSDLGGVELVPLRGRHVRTFWSSLARASFWVSRCSRNLDAGF